MGSEKCRSFVSGAQYSEKYRVHSLMLVRRTKMGMCIRSGGVPGVLR